MSHTTCQMTNPFNSYSSFFSSGLLAPYSPRVHRRDTTNSDVSEPWDSDADSYTPPSPSSPVPLVDEYMMDVDMSEFIATTMRNHHTRSVTPTPHAEEGQTTPMQQSPQPTTQETAPPTTTAATSSSSTATTTQPRLRRRRSSLTQATSPMNAIRSATRAAGNALHLQMQLPASTPRSRSGSHSLGGASDAMSMGMYGNLVGRMRSESCSDTHPSSTLSSLSVPGGGTKALAPSAFRPRRWARRNYTAPMPALRAPPPTAPLPAVPQQQLRPANLNFDPSSTATAITTGGAGANSSPSVASCVGPVKFPGASQTSARARGLSVSSSALGGDENRIEEEMKEN